MSDDDPDGDQGNRTDENDPDGGGDGGGGQGGQSGSDGGGDQGSNGGGGQSGNGGKGQNGNDGGGGQGGNGGGGGSKEGSKSVQKVMMAVSVTLTVLLFALVTWQLFAAPGAVAPQATVLDTRTMADGSVQVTVKLGNPQNVGLITATVESNCTSPPPQVQFSYVPADAVRTGTLVCPPGTTDPNVSVSSWVQA